MMVKERLEKDWREEADQGQAAHDKQEGKKKVKIVELPQQT